MKTPDIRIGTLAGQGKRTPAYLQAILPHGFESFQITFWQTLGDAHLPTLARETHATLAGSGAIVSSLGVFGNPLGTEAIDADTRRGWELAIDHARDFGCDLVCGFAGRVVNKPIPDSIPRFKEVFSPLVRRASDHGVRLAFENCPMGGTWESGGWNIAHNPAAWELMFDAVPDANLGLEWEPCHQLCQLIDPLPQIQKWAKRIFHVHGKDATVRHDVIRTHGVFGREPFAWHRTPGFGDTSWTAVISELRRAGYTGTIDIEGWHDPVYRGELEMTGQVFALRHLQACRGTFVANPAGF
jgi:sugar phosphate isomerase/epimerase